MSGSEHVRVAVAQLSLDLTEPAGNRAAATDAVVEAAAAGARVVVLPELAPTGYVFRDRVELSAVAEPRDGATVSGWAALATRLGVVVVGGFAERGPGGAVFNSAVLVDPDGVRRFYRKAHLWDRERDLFTPGDDVPLVVDTAVGRLGVVICYDLEFPEFIRLAALDGAELICAPTNWPWSPRPADQTPGEVVRVQADAAVNRVAIAACDRVGRERDVDWVGGSCVVNADGYLVTSLRLGQAALLVADVDLAASRDKRISARNDVLADRRLDLYARGGRGAGGAEAPRQPARGRVPSGP